MRKIFNGREAIEKGESPLSATYDFFYKIVNYYNKYFIIENLPDFCVPIHHIYDIKSLVYVSTSLTEFEKIEDEKNIFLNLFNIEENQFEELQNLINRMLICIDVKFNSETDNKTNKYYGNIFIKHNTQVIASTEGNFIQEFNFKIGIAVNGK